jgi:hypothetical protein
MKCSYQLYKPKGVSYKNLELLHTLGILSSRSIFEIPISNRHITSYINVEARGFLS